MPVQSKIGSNETKQVECKSKVGVKVDSNKKYEGHNNNQNKQL